MKPVSLTYVPRSKPTSSVMFTQEALNGVPSLTEVKLYCSVANVQLELDVEYCAARMLPATSCMNTHRSSLAQVVAAIDVSCRSFGAPAGKPVVNDKLKGFCAGLVGGFSGAGTIVGLYSDINFLCFQLPLSNASLIDLLRFWFRFFRC